MVQCFGQATQRISVLAEREEEDYQQRGPLNWGLNPNQDRERNTDSFAIEYRTDISDALTLAASGRYDDNSEFESANTMRVEAVYQISDNTRLRSAYGTAVKNPTFSERFGFYTNFIGNPNLDPEESTSWELGVDMELAPAALILSATLFDSELENEINGFVYDPATFGFTSANKDGVSKRQGIELTASATLTDDLSINSAYTYTDSVESDGAGGYIDEVRRARHTGSLNVAWQATENLHINANTQFNGSQTDLYFPPFPTPSQTVTLDTYTLVNVTANYSATERLDIYVRLDNLLDDDYEEVFGFQTLGFGANLGFRFDL